MTSCLILMLTPSCAHGSAAEGERRGADVSSARASHPPRQPDGVFFDVTPAQPKVSDVARAEGVLALAEPITRDEALTLARSYFRAFEGDGHAFAPLLAPDARRLGEDASGDLAASLEKRIRALDYARSSAESLPVYDEVRLIPFDEVPGAARASNEMREGDTLVVVPIHNVRLDRARLFGPRVFLVLRRVEAASGGAWLIAGEREDDWGWP